MRLSGKRTMKASEVKRKTMTSLAYGPCPITSRMPWKKDMGSDLGWQSARRRNAPFEMTAFFPLPVTNVHF